MVVNVSGWNLFRHLKGPIPTKKLRTSVGWGLGGVGSKDAVLGVSTGGVVVLKGPGGLGTRMGSRRNSRTIALCVGLRLWPLIASWVRFGNRGYNLLFNSIFGKFALISLASSTARSLFSSWLHLNLWFVRSLKTCAVWRSYQALCTLCSWTPRPLMREKLFSQPGYRHRELTDDSGGGTSVCRVGAVGPEGPSAGGWESMGIRGLVLRMGPTFDGRAGW